MSEAEPNPFASPALETPQVEPSPVPLRDPSRDVAATDLAVVQEVSPPWNGRVLTPWHFLWAHLSRYWIYLLPTAFIFYVGNPILSTWRVSIFMSVALLVLLLMWGLFMFSSNMMVPFWFEDRYLASKLQREVRSRPESYTPAPNSTHCLFVACVPPENWQRARHQLSADVAMMRIDPYTATIYLEGDQFRYRIPVASLTYCSVEHFSQRWTEIWLLRLNFQATTGPQELFLRVSDAEAFNNPTNSGRQRNAEKYWTRIILLQQQHAAKPTSPVPGGPS
ncbi:hypothetical protein DTL42_23310 [Bremerella cremea]|uniref:Uncharacterized protein n=1 Tax=Bremerella cremea TaxID=1031537 RepID=A0A368KNF8_9BACT|nr:hypothetical protein [Bremerella cremea]RCS41483.1 hypothetical protein DTL42_23310 [Bremerella cremea]